MEGEKLQDKIPSSFGGQEVLTKLLATHEIIDRPEKFAKMFCDVSDTQVIVREKLVSILASAINNDVKAKEEIKKILTEIHHEDWKTFSISIGGKIALALWTIFTIWLGHFWK